MKWMTLAVLATALAGCSGQHSTATQRTELTEHQRDSILSRASLPGASTVGRAMSASDGQARRAASMNAAVDSLPH